MFRIALCDDDAQMLDTVSLHINRYAEKFKRPRIEVYPFDSADSLLSAIEDGNRFDIFLLDVYIGDELGTSLARTIRKLGVESPIVFLTASIDHAPESFEIGTLRYLIKPLNPEKLYEALNISIEHAEKLNQKLVKLKVDGGSENVSVYRILFSEAHGHYQYLNMDDSSQIRVRMTVSELFETIENSGIFVRLGSAYIINLRKIKKISQECVTLINDKKISVPRGRYSDLKKAFWEFQYDEE